MGRWTISGLDQLPEDKKKSREDCGEAYYTPDISRRIDRIMQRFHESKLLVHPIAAGELYMREDVGMPA
ncbi:MAG: hypothetical protein C4B59_13575 [Candidatus Methanogaster sp.]|uniref:Uncharacterized protein n=1 Tax=Candidatus Methanogaster sp. TaxID=3386292 RepID=A0AC61KZG8_9EURY|nr:MAG: hypothetical protein C4B59_13575 [ANME-2 cluster archaeon]